MAFFNDYQVQAITPGHVEAEGDYEVMILGCEDGKTPDNAAFKRVVCKINYKGEPRISIFLTEGKNFNGNFTAFCDTFGLQRGDTNFSEWRGKRGWIHINLVKKDGFINMVPRWILDEKGFVKNPQQRVQAVNIQPKQAPAANVEEWNQEPFSTDTDEDIPF